MSNGLIIMSFLHAWNTKKSKITYSKGQMCQLVEFCFGVSPETASCVHVDFAVISESKSSRSASRRNVNVSSWLSNTKTYIVFCSVLSFILSLKFNRRFDCLRWSLDPFYWNWWVLLKIQNIWLVESIERPCGMVRKMRRLHEEMYSIFTAVPQ